MLIVTSQQNIFPSLSFSSCSVKRAFLIECMIPVMHFLWFISNVYIMSNTTLFVLANGWVELWSKKNYNFIQILPMRLQSLQEVIYLFIDIKMFLV